MWRDIVGICGKKRYAGSEKRCETGAEMGEKKIEKSREMMREMCTA